VKLTTDLHLVRRLRISGAMLVLSLCAFMAWKGENLTFYCIYYELWLFQVPPDESSLSAYDDTSSVELNNAGSERETGTSSSSGRTSTVDSNTSYYNNWAFLKVKVYGLCN
jgi:hypothetical protein